MAIDTEYAFTKRDEERIKRQVNDIAEGNESWKAIKAGALSTLYSRDRCWADHFAIREAAVACETLCRAGINCGHNCDYACEINAALRIALDEIARGLRVKPQEKKKTGFYRKTIISVSKKGNIIITQVM